MLKGRIFLMGALVVATIILRAQTTSDRVETLERAAALIARHDFASAAQTLQPLLTESPDDPLALNLLGVVRMEQERPAEAEALFHKAIQSGDKIPGPHINLARLYAVNRPLNAVAELKAAL